MKKFKKKKKKKNNKFLLDYEPIIAGNGFGRTIILKEVKPLEPQKELQCKKKN